MDRIPIEIWLEILINDFNLEDLHNLELVCRQFNRIVRNPNWDLDLFFPIANGISQFASLTNDDMINGLVFNPEFGKWRRVCYRLLRSKRVFENWSRGQTLAKAFVILHIKGGNKLDKEPTQVQGKDWLIGRVPSKLGPPRLLFYHTFDRNEYANRNWSQVALHSNILYYGPAVYKKAEGHYIIVIIRIDLSTMNYKVITLSSYDPTTTTENLIVAKGISAIQSWLYSGETENSLSPRNFNNINSHVIDGTILAASYLRGAFFWLQKTGNKECQLRAHGVSVNFIWSHIITDYPLDVESPPRIIIHTGFLAIYWKKFSRLNMYRVYKPTPVFRLDTSLFECVKVTDFGIIFVHDGNVYAQSWDDLLASYSRPRSWKLIVNLKKLKLDLNNLILWDDQDNCRYYMIEAFQLSNSELRQVIIVDMARNTYTINHTASDKRTSLLTPSLFAPSKFRRLDKNLDKFMEISSYDIRLMNSDESITSISAHQMWKLTDIFIQKGLTHEINMSQYMDDTLNE